MGSLVFQATLGGQVNLNGPNTASTFDIAVPATTGTMVTTGDSGTVTNTMLAASAYNTPGTIGSGTANTGAFTTLSASSTVSGAGFSTYLASPPAIGGTAAAAGSFTALSYSTTLTGGTGIVNLGSGQFYKSATGSVGIGTTSPSQKFVVSNAGADNILMAENTTASIQLYMQATTTGGVVGTLTNHVLAFYTNNTERMRIDTSGNVGIGTSSPSASAILDAQSTTKGVRMPNMTTTQKNAISSPGAGLMVFDTTLAKLCVYSGSAWQTITSI
jgi:hypothetical protein